MNTKNIYFTTINPQVSGCYYLDHYIFIDPISGANIFYPLTAYGGPLSAAGGVTFDKIVSGGPMSDACLQDYCFNTIDMPDVFAYCTTTINFILTGLEETTGAEIIRILYNFGDGSPIKEISYNKSSPKNQIVSNVYYPSTQFIKSYMSSISVVKADCCITTYNTRISSFRCSILDVYEQVSLINAQPSNISNVLLTVEDKKNRQLFSNLLNLATETYNVPSLSTIPNLVETVPPNVNAPAPIVPVPTPPTNENPVQPPAPGYVYREGTGIDLTPDYVTIVPPEYIDDFGVGSIAVSGDGPPYIQGEGITFRYS